MEIQTSRKGTLHLLARFLVQDEMARNTRERVPGRRRIFDTPRRVTTQSTKSMREKAGKQR